MTGRNNLIFGYDVFIKRPKFDVHKKYSDGICTGDFVVTVSLACIRL